VLAKTVYNTASPEEVELHEIEAENDVIATWMRGSSILGKRQREDDEADLGAGQAMVGPLVIM
jgi:hypothetical protein